MNAEARDPRELLRDALEKHHPGIALACSFQVEDLVLLDMMHAINPQARVFALDTGRLNEETYQVAERIRLRYAKTIEWVFPDYGEVEVLLRTQGPFSFKETVDARKECCRIRKVEPLRRALQGLSAWVTGMRREQSVTRDEVTQIETDRAHGGIAKYNPLALWTTRAVWDYVRERGIPYNRLYDRGYRQIGCAPCTTTVMPDEDDRAGRWRWEADVTKECGLHIEGSGI